MRSISLVVVGPYGAGKTTFINTLNEAVEIKPGPERGDYGRVTLDHDLYVHLFGAASHRRFDFMWEIMAEGMLGFILIIDSTRPETFREARHMLDTFRGYAPVRYVIAANKQDLSGALMPEDIGALMHILPEIKVLPCSAVLPESARNILLELLYSILEAMDIEPTSPPETTAEPLTLPALAPDTPLTLQRPMLSDAPLLAALWNADGHSFSAQHVRMSFASFGYLLVKAGDDAVGSARFYIENLVMAVELALPASELRAHAAAALFAQLDQIGADLQAEIAFAIRPASTAPLFETQGYNRISVDTLASKVWIHAIKQSGQTSAYLKVLRVERITQPI